MKVEQNNDNLTQRFMSIQRHNPGAHALLKSKTNDYIKYEGNRQNWEGQSRGLYYSDLKITNCN